MLDAKADFHPCPANAMAGSNLVTSPDDLSAEPGTDPRPVMPRRPLRFTAARTAVDARAASLPTLNLFSSVFDIDHTLTDERVQRGRARMRRLLAAHEASLDDVERNLWHDDPLVDAPEPETIPITVTVAGTRPDGTADTPDRAADTPEARTSGRRVRHLTAADIARHRPADAPVHDSLRDHLQVVRAALYDPDPDTPSVPPKPALTERITVQAINAALILTALPVGIVVSAITLLRGEDLRLSLRAVAVAGTASAFLTAVPTSLF